MLQAYNALNATLTAETAVIQNTVTDLNNDIRKLEANWKDLQSEHDRMEALLAKVQQDQAGSDGDTPLKRSTLRETLAEQLHEQESLAERLKKVSICFHSQLVTNIKISLSICRTVK